jgi:hypothetical protein
VLSSWPLSARIRLKATAPHSTCGSTSTAPNRQNYVSAVASHMHALLCIFCGSVHVHGAYRRTDCSAVPTNAPRWPELCSLWRIFTRTRPLHFPHRRAESCKTSSPQRRGRELCLFKLPDLPKRAHTRARARTTSCVYTNAQRAFSIHSLTAVGTGWPFGKPHCGAPPSKGTRREASNCAARARQVAVGSRGSTGGESSGRRCKCAQPRPSRVFNLGGHTPLTLRTSGSITAPSPSIRLAARAGVNSNLTLAPAYSLPAAELTPI